MKVVGIDPTPRGLNMQMVEVTEHGLRMLEPPIHILYSGPLRNGHGTIQVSRRKMPPSFWWDKVNSICNEIGANMALPGYMLPDKGLDVMALAGKAARKAHVEITELQQNLVSKFLRTWAKPIWEQMENTPVNPPPLTTVYDSDLAVNLHADATRAFVAEDIISLAFAKLRQEPGPAPTLQELADFINGFATGRLGNPK